MRKTLLTTLTVVLSLLPARYNADFGALRLVVTDTSLVGSFVSADGVTRDSFTIS